MNQPVDVGDTVVYMSRHSSSISAQVGVVEESRVHAPYPSSTPQDQIKIRFTKSRYGQDVDRLSSWIMPGNCIVMEHAV